MAQVVQKDRGGTLFLDVIDDLPNLPATSSPAPLVTCYDPTGATVLVAEQAATAGARTTLNGAVAVGATSLIVTAVTGLAVGQRLVVGPNASGQHEQVEVTGVNSSTKVVTVADELEYGYASGVVAGSPRLSVVLEASEVATYYRNCQARWVFSVGGQVREQTTLFTVSCWSPRCPATRLDVLDRDALAEHRISARQSLSRMLQIAWDEVLNELAPHLDPAAVVSGDDLRNAVCYKLLASLAPPNNDQEQRDRYHEKYTHALDLALASTPIDADGDGYTDTADVVPYSSMVGRLWRG